MKHQGQRNKAARQKLQARLSVIPQELERTKIYRANYALTVTLTQWQHNTLTEAVTDRGPPPGKVLARIVSEPDSRGRNIEGLSGWDYLSAYLEENAYSHWVPVSQIEVNDPDAVFYAIQHAYEEAAIAGFHVTTIEYAEAVVKARETFKETIPNMSRMASALRIGRTTLVNRLRLLDKLSPHLIHMTRKRQIPETAAKVIVSESDSTKQRRYAQAYLRDPMSITKLYALVQPVSNPQEPAVSNCGWESRQINATDLELAEQVDKCAGTPVELVSDTDVKGAMELRLSF